MAPVAPLFERAPDDPTAADLARLIEEAEAEGRIVTTRIPKGEGSDADEAAEP